MLLEKIELEPNETILLTVRKHWFVILAELFGAFVMVLIPFFIIFGVAVAPNLLPGSIDIHNYLPLIAFGTAAWLLCSLLAGFMIWTHYYLDLWIVTDRRIIVIDQIQFFNRKVSSFRLERLQDIKVLIDGIIPTFLNFGTIRAQTASAAESNFTSTGLPDPRNIQAIIQKATDERLRNISGQMTHLVE